MEIRTPYYNVYIEAELVFITDYIANSTPFREILWVGFSAPIGYIKSQLSTQAQEKSQLMIKTLIALQNIH